jgi:putative peptidoglycan lipid II flippase
MRAATIVMVAFVASRVLGLLREAVIGARFGALDEYGAYLAAFRLPDLIFNLIAGGALASAFLPTFTGFLTREDRQGGWRLASAVANWMLLFLGVVALGAALLAPWLVDHIIAPGFEPALMGLTARLMRLMLLSTVIFSLSGLLMSVLNAFPRSRRSCTTWAFSSERSSSPPGSGSMGWRGGSCWGPPRTQGCSCPCCAGTARGTSPGWGERTR